MSLCFDTSAKPVASPARVARSRRWLDKGRRTKNSPSDLVTRKLSVCLPVHMHLQERRTLLRPLPVAQLLNDGIFEKVKTSSTVAYFAVCIEGRKEALDPSLNGRYLLRHTRSGRFSLLPTRMILPASSEDHPSFWHCSCSVQEVLT